jgi:colanic acid biosynthesis glycosyl transferase WcaI
LKVAKHLLSYEEIIFVFIGGGVRKQEIYSQSLIQENIIILDYQDSSLLSHSLSSAHIHFISLKPRFSGIMVPSKFYSSLATGRPIIYEGSNLDELALVIKENQCGEVVEPENVDDLSTAILSYFNCQEKRILHGSNALYASEKIYSPEISTTIYTDYILEILGTQENKNSSC